MENLVPVPAAIAAIVVFALSGLHFAWAARVWWPISDEKQLARAVNGFPKVEAMPPPLACLVVAIALLAVTLLLLADILMPAPDRGLAILLGGAGLVFACRGAAGFTSFWSRLTPVQPFRRLDRNYYSPLCLVLGGTILLAAMS